ncbi:MAG: hypothetical protein ACREQ8_05325 [Woeseiaceae bacterium]
MSLNSIVMLAAVLLLLVSFWKRNDIPDDIVLPPAIDEEPLQSATMREPFPVEYGGVVYRVDPQYDYDLYGLVVSYRQHDDSSRMHRLANDHLNMADLCVVWGSNARSEYLNKLDFWNGVFTCNVKTSDSAAWASFDMTKLSNNHLISNDAAIRDRVLDVKIGDQVRVRGVLASYGSGDARRGTSTTRRDTGDGACETIFVDQFEIVETAPGAWRTIMVLSLALAAITLIRHFRRPYRPHET